MSRLRKLFGVPRYRKMRLSGFIVRQRIGSNVVTVTRSDGTSIKVRATLRAGNVREIIIYA
jgi:hypothetical protein